MGEVIIDDQRLLSLSEVRCDKCCCYKRRKIRPGVTEDQINEALGRINATVRQNYPTSSCYGRSMWNVLRSCAWWWHPVVILLICITYLIYGWPHRESAQTGAFWARCFV